MDAKETSRLEAFSDGVFAVAITLLVLNIKIPGLEGGFLNDAHLFNALRDEWAMLVAYATSFLTIGIMWLNHHRLFMHIKRIDNVLLFINLLLLMVIVFIPVPTALLAQSLGHLDQHAAAIIYGGTCLVMACGFNGLWRYASYHHQLLGSNVNIAAVKAINRQYLFGPLLYLIIFAAAWVNTLFCIILVIVLALFFALPSHVLQTLFMRKKLVNASDRLVEQAEEEEL